MGWTSAVSATALKESRGFFRGEARDLGSGTSLEMFFNQYEQDCFPIPGQGSQCVGMGRDLASAFSLARQTFDEANEALGFDLAELALTDPKSNSS